MQRVLYRLPFNETVIRQQLLKAYRVEVARRHYGEEMAQITPEIGRMLEEVTEWLHSPKPRPFLVLMGNIGNGKSTMAKSVATLYASLAGIAKERLKNRGLLDQEERWLYDRLELAPKWVLAGAQEIATATSNPTDYAILKTSPCLIIDDMGVEPTATKVFGTDATPIVDVLLYRYEKMLPTIITTNLSAKEIGDRYGTRIYDRMKEVSKVLVYSGESFR